MLFHFDPAPATAVGLLARKAGNRVLTSEYWGTDPRAKVQVWERRHPEGWRGHFARPEVLAGLLILVSILVLWINRPRSN